NAQFFIVSLDTGEDSLAWVFSKDTARPGQFVPATIGSGETSQNIPTLTLPLSSGTVTYVGGDTFFAAAQMNTTASTWVYHVLTWCWSSQAWDVQTVTPSG